MSYWLFYERSLIVENPSGTRDLYDHRRVPIPSDWTSRFSVSLFFSSSNSYLPDVHLSARLKTFPSAPPLFIFPSTFNLKNEFPPRTRDIMLFDEPRTQHFNNHRKVINNIYLYIDIFFCYTDNFKYCAYFSVPHR